MRHARTCLAAVAAVLVVTAAGAVVATVASAQGTIVGHVREASGFGIAGAEVRVRGGTAATTTDAIGWFRLQNLPAGRVKLSARRIGYRPATIDETVIDGGSVEVMIALDVVAVQIAEVTVRARVEPFDARLAGFRERLQKHAGYFVTRDRIEASSTTTFTDLLRGIPGVRLGGSARGSGIRTAVRLRGANCPPLVFVDGFPATAAEFDLDVIDPATVEGVEVYSSMATVPSDFVSPRGLDRCGVVAVWSRPFRPRARPSKASVPQAELQRLVEASSVYAMEEVDVAAQVIHETFAPLYPDTLWRAGVGGHAKVEFVVDAAGRVEMEYFSVVAASHPEFAEAVREALEKARFLPAVKVGRSVRQLVHLPVTFDRPKPPPSRFGAALP